MLLDEFTESQTFVQLPHQNQTSVGGDSRSFEIDFQCSIERELKGLNLVLPCEGRSAVVLFRSTEAPL